MQTQIAIPILGQFYLKRTFLTIVLSTYRQFKPAQSFRIQVWRSLSLATSLRVPQAQAFFHISINCSRISELRGKKTYNYLTNIFITTSLNLEFTIY